MDEKLSNVPSLSRYMFKYNTIPKKSVLKCLQAIKRPRRVTSGANGCYTKSIRSRERCQKRDAGARQADCTTYIGKISSFLIRLVNAFPRVNAIGVYRLLFSNANPISGASLREGRTRMIDDLPDPARILLTYLHQRTRKHRQRFQIAQYATIVIRTIDPRFPRRVAPPLIASTCSR